MGFALYNFGVGYLVGFIMEPLSLDIMAICDMTQRLNWGDITLKLQ